MSKIIIKNAIKRYGNNTVIPDLSLEVQDGELFTLLGASGCGKTTLLRMIAGFNSIEGGDFYFNEKRINDIDPSKRNIGMVFQNYAIFPHLTVRQNVEYGLKNRRLSRFEIKKESDRFLHMMQIDSYAERLPESLSGGQQQRVALARALAIKPDVLLMDEPLSNLDAKLRLEMRTAIRDIQHEVGITTVYVTHDQEEAMSISDNIAVMDKGIIQQIGNPREIYQRPKNLFVATFVGRTNVINATIEKGSITFHNGTVISDDNWKDIPAQIIKASIRPEEFVIHNSSDDIKGFTGTVISSIYLGLNTHYTIRISNNENVEVVRESIIDDNIHPGDGVILTVKKEKINFFNESGQENLITG